MSLASRFLVFLLMVPLVFSQDDSLSSTGPVDDVVADAKQDGVTAAIIICTVFGLVLASWVLWKLAERYFPGLVNAINPQRGMVLNKSPVSDTTQTIEAAQVEAVDPSPVQIVRTPTEVQMKAISRAGSNRTSLIKDKDSHAIDVDPLSINEQWTVRDETAPDDTAQH